MIWKGFPLIRNVFIIMLLVSIGYLLINIYGIVKWSSKIRFEKGEWSYYFCIVIRRVVNDLSRIY